MDLHEAVQKLIELARTLGRTPTRLEFFDSGVPEYTIRRLGWNNILAGAGMTSTHVQRNKVSKREMVELVPRLAREPRIMFLDIETSYMTAKVWRQGEQRISPDDIIDEWFVMSFCAEVDGVVHYLDQRYSKPVKDDSMLIMAIHHLMRNSDIIYTWNGDKFDLKKLNARFVFYGLDPLSHFTSVDGLKIARKKFAFTSNRLDDVAKLFGIEGKAKSKKFPGRTLWDHCMNGDIEAFEEMEIYNRQDVQILKEVMEKLAPWSPGFNRGVFTHEDTCVCGSKEFEQDGFKTTKGGKFLRFVCLSCKAEMYSRQNMMKGMMPNLK